MTISFVTISFIRDLDLQITFLVTVQLTPATPINTSKLSAEGTDLQADACKGFVSTQLKMTSGKQSVTHIG